MPINVLQPTLNGGVAAPGLWHRVDQQKFSTWLREAVNYYVVPQGGAVNRAGTFMLAPVKKFSYTYEQTIPLYAWGVAGYEERGVYYTQSPEPVAGCPVYKNDEKTPSLTATAFDLNSNPATMDITDGPWTWTVLRQPSWDTSRTVVKTGHKSKKARLLPFVFSKTQAYALEVGDGYIRFFNSDGQLLDEHNLVYELPTDLTKGELKDLYYCQSADVMYFARNGKRPKQLERYGHTDWKYTDYLFMYGPLKLENKDDALKISSFYDTTAKKFYLTCEQDLFSAGDVGAWWKIKNRLKAVNFAPQYTTQANTISDPMLVSGEMVLQTTGTWGGKVDVQYSADPNDENSWTTLHTITSIMYHDTAADQDVNSFNANDVVSVPAGLWWVRVKPAITNGRCYLRLDCEEQEVGIFYKITEYVSPLKAAATLVNDTKNLETYFSTGREYKSCIPTFTSAKAPSGTYNSLQADFWKVLDGRNDTVFSMANNTSQDQGGFNYTFPSAVVITSIAILGHNIEGAIGNSTSNDNIILAPNTSAGAFNVRSVQRGKEVTFTAGGQTYKETWRIFNVSPVVASEINFSVSADSASSNTSPKHLVQIQVRGYDYVAGQEITINATARWSEGAWSDKNGWPSCVAQHSGRLAWGQLDSVQGTQIGDSHSFAVSSPMLDSDAFSTTLRDDGINTINALVSMKSLVAFTAGGVFASNSAVMTPTDAGMPKQSADGGSNVRPAIIGTRVIYALPKATKLHDSAYDYSTDAFHGNNLCYIAAHLFENDHIVEMAYQQEPDGLLWVLLESGKLLCLTYVHTENVCAWTEMQTDGKIESICCIPAQGRDELFLIVNRSGVRFVEKMAPRLESKEPAEQFFVDCGRTYRGEPASVISGLDYLEGKEVAVLADGQVEKRQTVQDGKITLSAPARVVHVGLPYTARLRTLCGDINTESGSVFPKKKRYVGAMVSFVDSQSAVVGAENDMLEKWLPEKPLIYNQAKPLATEDVRFTFAGKYETMPSIVVEQQDPLPLMITAIVPCAQVGNL